MGLPLRDRFMSHVEVTPGCWLWLGQRAGTGRRYGSFRRGTKSTDAREYAHRVSYELWVGPIPDGMVIDHVKGRGCVTTLCVNPAHLEPVPPSVNAERTRLRVCRAGKHDLTDDANVIWDRQGRRRGCRPCDRERSRNFQRALHEGGQ